MGRSITPDHMRSRIITFLLLCLPFREQYDSRSRCFGHYLSDEVKLRSDTTGHDVIAQ